MKYFFMSAVASVMALLCVAQVQNPVSIETSYKKINGTTYEVHISMTLDKGWHTYSQTTPAGGPVPTRIRLNHNPLVSLTGNPKESGELYSHFEKLFNVEVKEFAGKVTFIQAIRLRKPVKTNISGTIEYMVCNNHECLPPVEKAFSLQLN